MRMLPGEQHYPENSNIKNSNWPNAVMTQEVSISSPPLFIHPLEGPNSHTLPSLPLRALSNGLGFPDHDMQFNRLSATLEFDISDVLEAVFDIIWQVVCSA